MSRNRGASPWWFWATALLVGSVALTQAYDALRWATSPWLGLTVVDFGGIQVRQLDEAPVELRDRLPDATLRVVAVKVADSWQPLLVNPNPARGAHDRLRSAVAGLPVGTEVVLAVQSTAERGERLEIPALVARVPTRVVIERCGLYAGMGLLIAAFGLIVFQALPSSAQALSFLVLSTTFGTQLLATQVYGGVYSRFHWLAIPACYVTPAAAAALALALEPRPFLARRPWLRAAPWALASAGIFGAMWVGEFANDVNGFVTGLRIAGWSFFAGYMIWARMTATSRQQQRKIEFYLGGMAAAFLLPAYWYTKIHFLSPAAHPPPAAMLTLLLFPLVIGYGILKHRLFDIDVALRSGLGYTALMGVALAVYGALVAAASTIVGPEVSRSPVWVSGFVISALLAGNFLKPKLQRVVDRGINPARFRYLESLREASAEIAGLADEGQIARCLLRVATGPVGLQGALVYLRKASGLVLAAKSAGADPTSGAPMGGDEPLVGLALITGSEIHRTDFETNPRLASMRLSCLARMDELGIDLIIPLGTGASFVGLLALAPRGNGPELNSEDLDYLRTLTNQAASAIGRHRADGNEPTAACSPQPERIIVGEGVRLGRYAVETKLGEGGMGAVFLARDQRLERPVALKFLRESHAENASMMERLRREARALATLNHPAIMQIYSLEQEAGHTFLVVEYLAGQTLKDELAARGPLPLAEAVDITITLATALGFAFDRRLLHRDVKLANVIRAADGAVKLTDFGLAKLTDAEVSLTGTDGVVGTPGYLAPELLHGLPASSQSDMFALGVALFQLSTGRAARDLQSRGPADLTFAPITAGRLGERGVPKPLLTVVARMLEVRPTDRHASYADLIIELRAAAG